MVLRSSGGRPEPSPPCTRVQIASSTSAAMWTEPCLSRRSSEMARLHSSGSITLHDQPSASGASSAAARAASSRRDSSGWPWAATRRGRTRIGSALRGRHAVGCAARAHLIKPSEIGGHLEIGVVSRAHTKVVGNRDDIDSVREAADAARRTLTSRSNATCADSGRRRSGSAAVRRRAHSTACTPRTLAGKACLHKERLREGGDVRGHHAGVEGACKRPAHVACRVAHVRPHRCGAARHVALRQQKAASRELGEGEAAAMPGVGILVRCEQLERCPDHVVSKLER
eukprot:scaffold67005_cov28-Tisochrysis_lutea.AAC.5